MALITSFVQSIRKAIYGRDVRDSICNALEAMNRESENAYQAAVSAKSSATNSASAAAESEANARASATEASNAATAAAGSEAKAKTSQTAAAASEANAKASETAAKNAETELIQAVENANAAATTATEKAQEAAASEAKAKTSQTAAAASEANAKASETAAKNVATELTQVVENANAAADNANTQAQAAQSAAVAASKWADVKTNAVSLASNMQPTVSIRSSEDGSQVLEFGIPKGNTGVDGSDYVLTEADKREIAGMVKVSADGVAKIDDTAPSANTTYSSQKIEAVVTELNAAKANDADLAKVAKTGSYDDLTGKPTIPTVPSSLPNPNKLILSGAVTAEYDGSAEVSVEIPAGGSGSYELPIASATQLGGVMPVAATEEMTQSVGVDDAGGLWTAPGVGTKEEVRIEMELTEEASVLEIDLTDDQREFLKTITEVYAHAYIVRPSEGSTESTGFQNVTFGLKHPNYFAWQIFTGKVAPTPTVTYASYCNIKVIGRPVINAGGLSELYAVADGSPQNVSATIYNTYFNGSNYRMFVTFRLQCDTPMGVGTKAVLIARR